MKVTGPGQGHGAPGAADAAGATDAAKPAAVQGEMSETFADKLQSGRAAGQAAEATRLQGAAFERAVEQVLERVIEEQLGPGAGAQVPAAVRESLRAALRDTLENDPFLAEKLRQLNAEP